MRSDGEKKKLLLLKRRVRARWDLRRGRLEGTHVYRFMYSWGVNASSPCSFSRMPRSFTMPFCSCAKQGGRSDGAREGAASDPRRVTFARKTGAERRAAEGTAGVSEGPAGTCLHEVPSLLQVDDLAVVHHPGRTRVAVALRRSRVGTLAQSLRDLRLGRGDVVARYALSREPGAPNDGDAEHSGRAPNQRAATTRALLHSGAGGEGATSNEARENTRNTDSGTRLSRQSPFERSGFVPTDLTKPPTAFFSRPVSRVVA